MSSYLWKAFFEDDSDAFARYLETAASNARSLLGRAGSAYGVSAVVGSPEYASSPTHSVRSRKAPTPRSPASSTFVLSKADVNWRDSLGLTLLHHIASSTNGSSVAFASALLEHPQIDLYIQDHESGWTALHRAFYFGNITIARMIMERSMGFHIVRTSQVNQLIKIKDREGLGPLDLYAATIKDRTLRPERERRPRSGSMDSDDERGMDGSNETPTKVPYIEIGGDQLFSFGSGNNNNLGLGDQDDRAFPERVNLRRPEHLIRKFYEENLTDEDHKWSSYDPQHQRVPIDVGGMWIEDIPWTVRSRPLTIQNVFMAKFHSAVLTTDPECNLYMCGHGQGGRLGLGDERTRFYFVCVEGGALSGKKVADVALGQNHTLALTEEGEVFSWGSNKQGQLGYSLPRILNDEDPISVIPRQIFGPLKRETVLGIAASRLHSVVHTSTSLFTFGHNEGQLGIVDSDARSLESQTTPRKVAASLFASNISAVAAIDRATICLLENHDVWVFANYGYAKVPFPLEGFSNYFLQKSFLVTTYDATPNRITKVTAEGDAICAMSSRGEVFTVSISQRNDNQTRVSTTNPAKIRSAISQPQRIWSPKKSNMAARDVGLDVNGSIIISTEEGSVWKRTKRAKIKDASVPATTEYRPKDYKFSRIPGLTRVLAVRSSAHGAHTALRHDCDVVQTQIVVEDPTLWRDLFPLMSVGHLADLASIIEDDEMRHRFWQSNKKPSQLSLLRKAVIGSSDIEADLAGLFEYSADDTDSSYDAVLATTSSEVRIPVHRFLLTARSRVLRRGLRDLCEATTFTVPDLCQAEIDTRGRAVITFHGIDIMSILNLAIYTYTDSVVDLWNFIRDAPQMAYAYRQVRVELMKIASKLQLLRLEPAVRQMVEPRACLEMDLEVAMKDPSFFHDADVVVDLEDDEIKVHSTLLCARCPFFEGLFMGRARGAWIAGRRANDELIRVDLKHVTAKTFDMVLRHIYYDAGTELFDSIVSTDLDDFLDTVTDVLSCANELMLDRLSQVAQSVVGRYVNTRNICSLLNAISPSSERGFLDAGLEYLCLNLEAMLQGHHLNELDSDLLEELDEVVRANQLAYLPFSRSGRADLLLHERHPELAAAVDGERQRKIDAVTLRSKYQDLASLAPGSYNDDDTPSPLQQKTRRKSSNPQRTEEDRPIFAGRASGKDTMFEMDEDAISSPNPSPLIRPKSAAQDDEVWFDARGKALPSPKLEPQSLGSGAITPRTPIAPETTSKPFPSQAGKPWSLAPLPAKTGMKDIFHAQAGPDRTSMLSQSIATARSATAESLGSLTLPAPKLSQKDRKRMQQAQQKAAQTSSAPSEVESPAAKAFSWQSVSAQKQSSLKDVMDAQTSSSAAKPMTMRQTVANSKPQKQAIGPRAVQQRSTSENKTVKTSEAEIKQSRPADATARGGERDATNSRPIPQSIRHQPLVEAEWGLSMSEIVAQQQLEKNIIKDAVAKRDLQEIQAEQEFQEWWDKESARVQEAERRSSAPAKPRRPKGRGGGAGRGKGKKQSGEGAKAGSST